MPLRTWMSLWGVVLALACSSRSADDLGTEGPAGPQGPAGPPGPPGSRAVLRNAQNEIVGHFLGGGEIFFPAVGCAFTLDELDRTNSQLISGVESEIYFSGANCDGDPYTVRTAYDVVCLMSRSRSVIGTAQAFETSEKRSPQEAVTGGGGRFFRLRSPVQRVTQTVNSRLDGGFCTFLDPTNVRAFRVDEVNPPRPAVPLTINVE